MRSAVTVAVAAGLLLGAAAPAWAPGIPTPVSPPAPAVSVAADGTVAYAYPGDGLKVAVGWMRGGLGAPVTVAPLDEIATDPASDR